jgi:DNA-directed RNA polymerase specialized sigma24 family protein
VSSANLPNPAGSGGYEELAAIACDPGMRRAAWRLAGDMADDLLQETWYAMVRTAARESIESPRGYFYKTMVNTWRHLRQDLARHGIPADDLDAAAGAAKGMPSAEDDALARLDAAARQGRLQARRAELWLTIPPYSQDPHRYRSVVMTVAETAATGDGPVTRAELNEALAEAYPEWFGEPGVKPGALQQRRCRARQAIWRLLADVLGPEDLRP